jgi:hypothetical protein
MGGRFWLFPQVRDRAGLLSQGRSQGFKIPSAPRKALVRGFLPGGTKGLGRVFGPRDDVAVLGWRQFETRLRQIQRSADPAELQTRLHRLFDRNGWAKSGIAEKLGMSRNTVTPLPRDTKAVGPSW